MSIQRCPEKYDIAGQLAAAQEEVAELQVTLAQCVRLGLLHPTEDAPDIPNISVLLAKISSVTTRLRELSCLLQDAADSDIIARGPVLQQWNKAREREAYIAHTHTHTHTHAGHTLVHKGPNTHYTKGVIIDHHCEDHY